MSKPAIVAKPQWCELHMGPCTDVDVLKRRVRGILVETTEIITACKKCLKELRDAGLTQPGKWAGHEVEEIRAPRRPVEGRRMYFIDLTPIQVKYLRAVGVEVLPLEKRCDI